MAQKYENKYVMFRASKPWGYYPPDVEEKINDLKEEISIKERENEDLKSTIMSLRVQMQNMELPDVDEAVSENVLNSFAKLNPAKETKNNIKLKIGK